MSVAPFSQLAHRHGGDLAIVWIDSHPDVATWTGSPRPAAPASRSTSTPTPWTATIVLGLGAEPDGLTSSQVRRIVTDLGNASDVVGLTIAEFLPRQVMHLQQILNGFPCSARQRRVGTD